MLFSSLIFNFLWLKHTELKVYLGSLFSLLHPTLYQNKQQSCLDIWIPPARSHLTLLFEIKMVNRSISNRQEKHTYYFSPKPFTVYKVKRKVSYTLLKTKATGNKWHVLTWYCPINTHKGHIHRQKEWHFKTLAEIFSV